MAKVMVYEDDVNDLIRRYSGLTSSHDVHVRHSVEVKDPCSPLAEEWTASWVVKRFENNGFNVANFREGYDSPESEVADVFFVDGLGGRGLSILERLPRDKAFLNTDSQSTEKAAQEKGYQILSGSPEEAIVKVLSQ